MTEKSAVPYDTISKMPDSTQPMVSKCCFCVPIRLGCLILGYVNLLTNVYKSLYVLVCIAGIGIATHGFETFDLRSEHTHLARNPPDGVTLKAVTIVLIAVLLISALWFIITIACIVGVHKKRPGPIRVYIGFATAYFALGLAADIYLRMSIGDSPGSIIAFIFNLGIASYFIYVYYTYAGQLEREREAAAAQAATVTNVILYPAQLEKGHLVAKQEILALQLLKL